MQSIHPDCDESFNPVCHALIKNFIPSLTGNPITEIEFQVYEKPTRLAGLGIQDPLLSTLFRHFILLLKAPKFYPNLYSQKTPLILTLMKQP